MICLSARNRDIFGSALNDIVLHPGKAVQMIEFMLYIDQEFVHNQASDGLYRGDSDRFYRLCHVYRWAHHASCLDAMVLVPINPHSLSSRPIVIDSNSELTLVVGDRHRIMPQLSCDGAMSHPCTPGDRITIRKKKEHLKIVHPADYQLYETCRSKLGWSHRPTNS